MMFLRLAILPLLMLTGCSANPAGKTIGLRVFNENPRHFDSNEKIEVLWLELRVKTTDDIICRAIIPTGFGAPLEIYGIPKNQHGLIFVLKYDGIVDDTAKYDIAFEQVIPADGDLDIRIQWRPPMPPEAPLLEQLKRKPKLDINCGHKPIF